MRMIMTGCAALVAGIAAAAPAQAQFAGSAFAAPSQGVSVSGGDWADRDPWTHRRHRRDRVNVLVGNWGGGEWARYNNRSWESDSYNDWWHDRPDRAFPRWVRDNQNCDRRWWSGGVWRC